jgi:ferrous-iron efflux pump FieF
VSEVEPNATRAKRRATYASVSVAVTLVIFKTAAWLATDSVALLSSLIDSLTDVGASLVIMLAVRQAVQPADREHRFGHGKAEALAGLAQAAFVGGSGLFLLGEAVGRILNPPPLQNVGWGVAVMIVSVLLTFGLIIYQRGVIRRTGSLAITADAFHYTTDLASNLAVAAALLVTTTFGWSYADPLVALGIVTYMGVGAFSIGSRAVDDLMDRELPDGERQRIREIALAVPGVISVHDLRTRSSGSDKFIQIHLELPRDLQLLQAHEISDQVMYNVEAAFPQSEVLVHQDPEGVDERRDRVAPARSTSI